MSTRSSSMCGCHRDGRAHRRQRSGCRCQPAARPQWIKAPSAALVGEIAAFIYRCPNTGLPIQALSAAEGIAEGEKTYEPVTCIMCRQVHLVNAFTGKVLGDDNE